MVEQEAPNVLVQRSSPAPHLERGIRLDQAEARIVEPGHEVFQLLGVDFLGSLACRGCPFAALDEVTPWRRCFGRRSDRYDCL